MNSSKRLRIFYADDDEDDIYFFSDAVKEVDCECDLTTFSNGVDLLKNIKINLAVRNIIFLDINMPLKNGLDTLRDLKNSQQWSSVPVYLISTSNDDNLKEKAISLGAEGYLEKPSDYNELREMVRAVLATTFN
jgi:CheY-like chemotaxis protein